MEQLIDLLLNHISEMDVEQHERRASPIEIDDTIKNPEIKELRASWVNLVPALFSQKSKATGVASESFEALLEEQLMRPLEKFILGEDAPDDYFSTLKNKEVPSTVCSRVFRMGEPNYSCRECCMDATCVLCVQCFENSVHKDHRYKISTSGGGGYCDCGDSEAWKNGVHCSIHDPKNNENSELPIRVLERMEDTVKICLKYCYEVLFYDSTLSIQEFMHRVFERSNIDDLEKDEYSLLVFNDEAHTFDTVISTLTKAVTCTHKEAVNFATVIDQEGRAILVMRDFHSCNSVKKTIERLTVKPTSRGLKVSVFPALVACYQWFALRLLRWLKEIASSDSSFRETVAEKLFAKTIDTKELLVEKIMVQDTFLWKAARSAWHHLFIASLLKDYEFKKRFAKSFSHVYADIMREFIDDDHDHSFSVTSLSVQIFTVPSIAQFLIEECEIIFTIMRTFLSECEQRLNLDRKLDFSRGNTSSLLKRTNYTILDLKYILSCPPDEWREKLAKNFVKGIVPLIDLLTYMQEMDSVVRQTGQHMEYEPEWESNFNLHIRLAPVITQVLEWCGTNSYVFVRLTRYCLSQIGKLYSCSPLPLAPCEVANHAVNCYDYDVGRQSSSVHLALTRFFAGLYLYFETFNFKFDSSQFEIGNKPSPVHIMEPALRTQTLTAQVSAGMWKRNGYSLLNQIFFYQNVRCRSEMLDRDILTLQIAASLIEGNEFLIHALNRYNLVPWAQMNSEQMQQVNPDDESVRCQAAIVGEFFSLILRIISARYVPGVGKVSSNDCVKKEVIQLLCIESMMHSTLNRSLVENSNSETGLESVIQDVADFKSAPGCGGVYELKPEFYSEYDIYHYHYSKEEKSKAEESQRKRKKLNKEPEVFPPPVLPPFTANFDMVVSILQSDVFLHLCDAVIVRITIPNTRNLYDSVLRKVLHLLGHGLNEEATRNESETLHFFQFTKASKNIFVRMEKLLKEPELSHHHDMIVWLRTKFDELSPTRNESEVMKTDHLTELQNNEEMLKKEKAAKAAERRAKMLAKMNEAQKRFMTVNAALFADETSKPSEERTVEDMDVHIDRRVALGCNQTRFPIEIESHTCILCQEEQDLNQKGKSFVMTAFVQRSSALCTISNRINSEMDLARIENQLRKTSAVMLRPDLIVAPYISSCGHIMHSQCWSNHMKGVVTKERRRPYRLRHPMSFDVDRNEWLCPMCDSICNTALPIVSPYSLLFESYDEVDQGTQVEVKLEEEDFSIWMNYLKLMVTTPRFGVFVPLDKLGLKNHLDDAGYERLMQLMPKSDKLNLCWEQLRDAPSPSIYSFIHHVSLFGFERGVSTEFWLKMEDPVNKPFFWQSLSYTIIAAEAYHRDQKIPFFGKNVPVRSKKTLKYLIRMAAVPIFDSSNYSKKAQYMQYASRILTHILREDSQLIYMDQCDAFNLLVVLTLCLPHLIERSPDRCFKATGTLFDYFLMKLMFMYHVVQILSTKTYESFVVAQEEEEGFKQEMTDGAVQTVIEFWNDIGKPVSKSCIIDFDRLCGEIRTAALPFLRCCAKFYEYLVEIPVDESMEGPTTDYEDVICYLGLNPSLSDMFGSKEFQKLIKTWSSHVSVSQSKTYANETLSSVETIVPAIYPRNYPPLVELPRDYTKLLNSVSSFTCVNFDYHDPRTPTKCLVCGVVLCSQSYCCQKDYRDQKIGACTFHALMCGGGQGIFLKIRECKVFCISWRNKGCFLSPPYVDMYGETDQGLRRGNPLCLNDEKYEQLRRLWINHGIQDEIARITEHSPAAVTTEWQFL